jgi:glycosyltransferase involved in cell wall biosynthesis
MLARQYEIWAAYPEKLKDKIDVVLVDDGSSQAAVNVERPLGLPDLQIWRVLIDKPWNQHGARNLGAQTARGPWLFLTDMDHIMPTESLDALLSLDRPSVIYTFHRIDIDTMQPTTRPDGTCKPHPNTFAMTKKLYWRIGGYDEDYCGIYGTDGLFKSRARECAKFRHLHNVPILRVPRSYIADASTTTLARKEGRPDGAKDAVRAAKRARGEENIVKTLQFPYEQVL